jgi:hypothetical protein
MQHHISMALCIKLMHSCMQLSTWYCVTTAWCMLYFSDVAFNVGAPARGVSFVPADKPTAAHQLHDVVNDSSISQLILPLPPA